MEAKKVIIDLDEYPGVYGVHGGGPATSTYNTISDNTYITGAAPFLPRTWAPA